MASEDDLAYKRSVTNISLVLAATVLAVFAALFIPKLLLPAHETLYSSASAPSPYGFTLNLNLSGTRIAPSGSLNATVWLVSTSTEIQNVSASDNWAVSRDSLWVNPCYSARAWWPVGLGVMRGYYTEANFTEGTVVLRPQEGIGCLPVLVNSTGLHEISGSTPYFLLEPSGSGAIVSLNGNLEFWPIKSTFYIDNLSLAQSPSGTYTIFAADEWGDIAILHFIID